MGLVRIQPGIFLMVDIFLLPSPLTHLMKFRARDHGLSLFMSGKQSLSLSLDEESSVEAVEDILFINLKTSSCRLYFFARKQRHHNIRT